MSKNLITNEELKDFIHSIEPNEKYFAIRTKGLIEIFSSKKDYKKVLKDKPDAVNGAINVYNYFLYRF